MGKYTNIDDPSAHFQTLRWTGNSSSPRDLTFDGNSDMQPDFCVMFRETGQQPRLITDSSRSWGSANNEITWDGTGQEGNTSGVNTGAYGWMGPSISNGMRTQAGYSSNGYSNTSGRNYYAATWKANNATTSSNTDGNTTTTIQVNQDAGFSIVLYTGTGSGSQTMGHGLGVTPNIIMTKSRSNALKWSFNSNVGSMVYGTNRMINNTYGIAVSDTNEVTSANSTTFTGGGSTAVNGNGATYVAYCFAEKQGYSKFGSYIGNGNANGTFVYTGFKPRVIVTKKVTGSVGSWIWHDSRLGQSTGSGTSTGTDINPATANQVMESNSNLMDDYGDIDFLSNGFKIRDTNNNVNTSGSEYLYMAFAENPFVTSTGIMGTAR